MVFKFFHILVHWMKVASALEVLINGRNLIISLSQEKMSKSGMKLTLSQLYCSHGFTNVEIYQ